MRKKDSNDGQLSLFEPAEEKIIKQEYSDIMKQSYIDYAKKTKRLITGYFVCRWTKRLMRITEWLTPEIII